MAFQNNYWSLQGSLYAATRDASGRPMRFVRVGNMTELSIDIAVTKFDHKESETGDRGKDLTITQEKNGTFKFTLENASLDMIAMGLWGDHYTKPGGSVTGEITALSANSRAGLKHPKVSSVAVSLGTVAGWTASTTVRVGQYVQKAATPTNYAICVRAGTTGTVEPTWPTNGTSVFDNDVLWQDAGVLPTGSPALTTDYTLDTAIGSVVAVDSGMFGGLTWGFPVSVNYTYAAYSRLDAFTSASSPNRYLRFEGINTIGQYGAAGKKIVIDIPNAEFDPLTGYALINTELQQVPMGGSVLADPFATAQESKYFRVMYI